uniref:Uncharacterized protein n=1 Tax=Cacopsylla melanoneura TaxID=428564 RepID=A0A8D8U257_9HEMI
MLFICGAVEALFHNFCRYQCNPRASDISLQYIHRIHSLNSSEEFTSLGNSRPSYWTIRQKSRVFFVFLIRIKIFTSPHATRSSPQVMGLYDYGMIGELRHIFIRVNF